MEKINLITISDYYALSKQYGDAKALRKILFLLKSEGCTLAYKSLITDNQQYQEEVKLLGLESCSLIRFDFLKKDDFSKKNYLGYIQIRPSNQKYPINDAFIRIPENNINPLSHFITCKSQYTFCLPNKSLKFTISGTFFSQRDGTLGVCAHASLRMLSSYYRKELLNIPEIREIAGEPLFLESEIVPSNGLTAPKQINKVLTHLKLYPEAYNKPPLTIGSSDFYVEEFNNSYTIKTLYEALKKDAIVPDNKDINTIEELNELLRLPDLYSKIKQKKTPSHSDCSEVFKKREKLYNDEKTEDNLKWLNRVALEEFYHEESPKSIKYSIEEIIYTYIESHIPVLVVFDSNHHRGAHMVVITGHTFDSYAWWPEANEHYYQKLPYGNYLKSSSWVGFLGQDDNFGPYLSFPREFQNIDTVIVPLPYNIAIMAEFINPIIRSLVTNDEIQKKIESVKTIWSECLLKHIDEGKLLLRTFLISKKEFIRNINKSDVIDAVKNFYNNENLFTTPDRFWITEISVPEIFSQQRYCLGEIIINPNPKIPVLNKVNLKDIIFKNINQIVISIHLSGTIIIPNSEGKKWEMQIDGDVPYSHIMRT